MHTYKLRVGWGSDYSAWTYSRVPPKFDQIMNVRRGRKEHKVAPLIKAYVQAAILVHSVKAYEERRGSVKIC